MQSKSKSKLKPKSAPASNGNLKESPWDGASLLGKYSLAFMLPMFARSRKNGLGLDDISAPPRVDQSRALGVRLQHNYNQELLRCRHKPSFLRALWKTFGRELMLISLTDLVANCFAFPMQTIALGWLIRDTGIYLNFASPAAAIVATPLDVNATVAPPPTTTTTTATTIATIATEPLLTADEAYWRIINDAVLLLMFATLAVVCSHPFFFQVNHIGMKCRIASCYMIYKKSLRLSQSAMSATTVGQMVNLLSNDVNRFDQVTMLIPYTIEAPAQAVIIIFILSVFYLGFYPTLASLVVVVLYVAVQTAMGRGFSVFRSRTAKRTDERVRLMNEIILAMKIIKMYAWERPFKQLVHEARKREIATIAISSVLKCINHTLFFVSSKIIVFVALITYVALGNSLGAEIVFVSIGLADLMRVSLTLFFPNAIAFCAESVVSCQRIGDFLMLPEKKIHTSRYKVDSPADGRNALVMDKVYAFWETATSAATMMDYDDEYDRRTKDAIIRNLSLTIKQRDLVLIVGRVGSGKSSVLMSMLGELPVASGRLEINGRISYASQEPWIFSGTVRENILFGKPLNIDRYKEVLRVCSLERDIEILVDGDSTIVGERGVSLSGGQKARVNLARALYHEADIYLLDDPLSAVDAPVAKHIFNESLRTFLRKKTVLLATHQLQFLPFASKVLVLNRDFPAAYGTLEEVVQSEAFVKVNYGREAFKEAAATTTTANSESPAASETEEANERRSTKGLSQASTNLSQSVKSIAPLSLTKKEKKETSGAGNERREGKEVLTSVSADRDTYWFYARNATGVKMFIWFVATNFAAQGFFQYTDYYLSLWTDSVQRKAATASGGDFVPISFMDSLTSGQISSIYAGLIAVCFATAFCRAATYFVATLRASVNIHNKMFESVVHAPMNFFDFSPIGILLNRLSRDIGFVDETLPRATIEIISIFIQIAGIMITSMLINWWNIFAAAFLLSVSLWLRNKCASTIKRLKQIEGVTRSPIFSHLSTTLSGLSTIRAFKVQEEFLRLFDRQQDTHSSVWFSFICSSRWLAVSMDWLCISFICSVVTLLLLFSLDAQNASLVGLLISQALFLPGPFQWAVRQMVEIESQMTSVQRIKEFTELSSEQEVFGINQAAAESYQNNNTWSSAKPSQPEGSFELLATRGRPRAAHQKPIQGPTKVEGGEIKFCNLSLSYFPDEPPVLKELNFTIKPREKVGIVGRTGAGKSSIVSVLFRLYDFEGCVEIDGRDTKSMSLGELRRSMSIIPQDPILFGATIRKNLDPFAEHSDMELWAALEAVQLKPLFLRLEQGLDFVISEGGANFSVGQRQLICLARAIVRRNKILVLDEATANVDPETDVFIQRTISEQFADCTVLTIAHRLITIVDSDRVLVLDRGEVREFSSPYELLQTAETTSLFAQMVASSAQQAPRLRKLIERAHKRRLGVAAASDER